MSHILITGGNGRLGREILARMNLDRNTIRIMSRSSHPEKLDPRITWVQANLGTGEGLDGAVQGVDVILHLATGHSRKDMQRVDLDGTGAPGTSQALHLHLHRWD